MIKRVIVSILMIAFFISCQAYASPSEWAKVEIDIARKEGIFMWHDVDDLTLPITRSELAEILSKTYEKVTGDEFVPVEPVRSDIVNYDNDIQIKIDAWEVLMDCISGTVEPDETVKREDAFVYCTALIEYINGKKLNNFPFVFLDSQKFGSQENLRAAMSLYSMGILNGTSATTDGAVIGPGELLTREQTAALTVRLLQRAPDFIQWRDLQLKELTLDEIRQLLEENFDLFVDVANIYSKHDYGVTVRYYRWKDELVFPFETSDELNENELETVKKLSVILAKQYPYPLVGRYGTGSIKFEIMGVQTAEQNIIYSEQDLSDQLDDHPLHKLIEIKPGWYYEFIGPRI